MQELLDIHGQHETQSLLKQKYHLTYIGLVQNHVCGELINNITNFSKLSSKKRKLKTKSASKRFLQHFNFNKLDKNSSTVKEGEIKQLEIDIKRIQNSEKLSLALNNAHMTLTDENAITDRLYELSNHLLTINDIVKINMSKLKEVSDQFYYILEDAKHELYDEMANTEFDEQVLNKL